MKIPFSLPVINDDVINEVNDVFSNTRWLTSGPKVLEFEKEISKITNTKSVICVNSWSSGAKLILRWFGVGPGDEVIIPSYTYAATALAVLNVGATPVMVDVKDDFNIDPKLIEKAITRNTKAIIPVDIGGLPCDYESINKIVNLDHIKNLFSPSSENQIKLNRILIMADAAHSIGGFSNKISVGKLTDVTVFSFHSVKNITTGEGGAIALNLPSIFDDDHEYKFLKSLSLNGQTKSAFEKNQLGSWRYDIMDQGLKANMPDICAAIGLAQIKKYKKHLLPERMKIFKIYDDFFKNYNWALTPISKTSFRESSYHLYLLRINDISEDQRDKMINFISSKGVGVNVHYIPMAMLTYFKNKGYNINNYPNTYKLYSNEITLPVYNNLGKEQLDLVCNTVIEAYKEVL